MLQLHKEYVEQIREEARLSYPEEAAWLITRKGCRQVENIHDDPENFFDISAKDIQKAQSEGLLAVVHSHCNGLHYPSEMDMQYQINTAVPWGLLVTNGEESSRVRWWGGITADQVDDLLDRTFCHATSDCYALVRDFYLVNYGILLKEFPRAWRWWDTQNLLEEGFPQAGFTEVKGDPRPGDVWLASLSSRTQTLNHCGVLLDNGLTHHQPGSGQPINASTKAVIEPIYRYMNSIHKWVRHKDLA